MTICCQTMELLRGLDNKVDAKEETISELLDEIDTLRRNMTNEQLFAAYLDGANSAFAELVNRHQTHLEST